MCHPSGQLKLQTSSIDCSKESHWTDSASTAPKTSKTTLGSKTSNGTSFCTTEWLRPSFHLMRITSTPITQTASGKTITATRFSKICSCWIKRSLRSYLVGITMTKTSTKKWTKRNLRLNKAQTPTNNPTNKAKAAMSDPNPAKSLGKETTAAQRIRVILRPYFTNTSVLAAAQTYNRNRHRWWWALTNGLIKLAPSLNPKNSLLELKNTDSSAPSICLMRIVSRQPPISPDFRDQEPKEPLWWAVMELEKRIIEKHNNLYKLQ